MNHVLIVDDEAEIRDSLQSILHEEGYLVTTAATAKRVTFDVNAARSTPIIQPPAGAG